MSQDADPTVVDGSLTASQDGAILRLTLDRPGRRNSLTRSMIATFIEALTDAAADDSLRVIHIRGAGDDFCAGADWVASNSGDHKPRAGDLVRRIPLDGTPRDRVGPFHRAARGVHRARPERPSASAATLRWRPTSPWQPPIRCSGSRSSRAASPRTPAPRGCSPGSSVLATGARRMLLLGEKVSGSGRRRLGHDPPSDGRRRAGPGERGAGGAVGRRTHRGHRPGQAGPAHRPTRHVGTRP